MKNIKITVPGRICLFGEHQDYLGLPVITSAINLVVSIEGHVTENDFFQIDLPDIKSQEKIELPVSGKELLYKRERDYFRSAINVLHRQGIELEKGCHCRVHGNIPINSGTSSSSALTVAWVRFLLELGTGVTEKMKDPMRVAYLAHQAEVAEFGEPGGMMDHYSTAIGGLLYISFGDETKVESLNTRMGTFVLGDSGQSKDTKYVLSHVKENVFSAIKKIKAEDNRFDLTHTVLSQLEIYKSLLNENEYDVLTGTILNRDLTWDAKEILENNFNDKKFGQLLTEHHHVLDKKLRISTDKINMMLNKAIEAGAYGGKINGSGGGGCIFVYAPENPAQVARAIESVGGRAFIIHITDSLPEHNATFR